MIINLNFNPEEEVWFMSENKACKDVIKSITVNIFCNKDGYPVYLEEYIFRSGKKKIKNEIFNTKEELLTTL